MKQRESVRGLPDEDLVERAKLRGWRHLLHVRSDHIGCLVGLVGAALALVLVVHHTSVWALLIWLIPALVAGVVAMLMTMRALRALACGGRAPYVRELKRRYGQLGLGAHAADERREPGVTYSLLARCHGLPHGGIRFVRVRTHADGPASVEGFCIRANLDWVGGEHPLDLVQRARSNLARAEEAESMSLLADLAWGRADELRTTVRDGVPCEMRVLDHTRGAAYSLRCNLAGLPDEADENPGLRLLAFARARTPHHVGWAATSWKGAITLGEG